MKGGTSLLCMTKVISLRDVILMKPSIVWQTDFSLDWSAVAQMRGVVKCVDPTLEVYDITHTITQFDPIAASIELSQVERYWPKGTIFVSVVDPGVGTKRRPCVAKLKDGNYVVTPDNGTLTHMFYKVGIEEIRVIDQKHRLPGASTVAVFDGRDLFSYVAALLASGKLTYEEVGESYPVDEVIRQEAESFRASITADNLSGFITGAGGTFGGISTNIQHEDFAAVGNVRGSWYHVLITHNEDVIFDQDVYYGVSFGDVPVGDPIIYNGSSGYINIDRNCRRFVENWPCGTGPDWKVVFTKVEK